MKTNKFGVSEWPPEPEPASTAAKLIFSVPVIIFFVLIVCFIFDTNSENNEITTDDYRYLESRNYVDCPYIKVSGYVSENKIIRKDFIRFNKDCDKVLKNDILN